MNNRFRFFILLLLQPGIFPAQSWTNFNINICDPTSTGYYFLCPIKIGNNPPPANPTHLILDSSGSVIYYNEFFSGQNTGDFKIQPNELMSYSYMGKFYFMDSTFTIVDSVVPGNGILFDGHDMQILPNGHFLMLGTENVTMDLSSYNLFNHNGSPGSSNASVSCGVIQEQDQNHNVVFEWHSKNYYSFADVDPFFLNSPANVDWTHMNAVELDADGNILVSVRHFDEITKINRSDSSIIWRMGGNANQFTFTNDPNRFLGQHDVRRIANGNITLFDNGRGGSNVHPASGKEYSIDENLLGATLVWSYQENPNHFSLATGNCQRTGNGNTLIDWGLTGTIPQVFDVVDSLGTKIFEIQFADTLKSYRAFNYTNLPWQLPQPQITCYYNGQYYLDAGSGYSNYLWSTGATTQLIPVTVADTFFVYVGIGNGGHIRSPLFIVTNISNPCAPIGMDENNPGKVNQLYPDPGINYLFLPEQISGEKQIYRIYSITGQQISSGETSDQLNIMNLEDGAYFIDFENENGFVSVFRFIKSGQ